MKSLFAILSLACCFSSYANSMEILVKNDTDRALKVDVSSLKRPSVASDVWYHVPGLVSKDIDKNGSLLMFVSIEDTSNDKGYIRLSFSDGTFMDIVFKELSGIAGSVFVPELKSPVNNEKNTFVYKGIQSYDNKSKTHIMLVR